MLSKGDKIVHPIHGAAIVEGVEEKVIAGHVKPYYVLKSPVGNLTVCVPVAKENTLNIRKVYEGNKLMDLIASVKIKPECKSENWNIRCKDNMEKVKSGDLEKVTEVYKDLLQKEKEHSLSTMEKKMLVSAKQIILSEIILSRNVEKNVAESMLQSVTNKN